MSCENDTKVLHWLIPAKSQFDISYEFECIKRIYGPNFVVETGGMCYLVEVKNSAEMNDPQVQVKSRRILEYCRLHLTGVLQMAINHGSIYLFHMIE